MIGIDCSCVYIEACWVGWRRARALNSLKTFIVVVAVVIKTVHIRSSYGTAHGIAHIGVICLSYALLLYVEIVFKVISFLPPLYVSFVSALYATEAYVIRKLLN